MTDHSALIERLENGADRFLKWTYKHQYSGPPVISIPRHPDNIDALLHEAADALREYRQALRDFNLMRDDGTLPSAPNQAKEAGE